MVSADVIGTGLCGGAGAGSAGGMEAIRAMGAVGAFAAEARVTLGGGAGVWLTGEASEVASAGAKVALVAGSDAPSGACASLFPPVVPTVVLCKVLQVSARCV